jgi:signal transduction histidine kinase
LLRIAQIETGARKAAFSCVDLAQIVTSVTEAYAPVAEDRGQRLEAMIGHASSIHGDRDLLMQLVANLIENPIHHCPAGVTITAGLRQDEDATVLYVADTGPGIPAAERDKVLRRFYRLEASRTTPGNGLGLSIVKAIADLHGASVQLSDNQHGLQVSIRFPVAAGRSASRKSAA